MREKWDRATGMRLFNIMCPLSNVCMPQTAQLKSALFRCQMEHIHLTARVIRHITHIYIKRPHIISTLRESCMTRNIGNRSEMWIQKTCQAVKKYKTESY